MIGRTPIATWRVGAIALALMTPLACRDTTVVTTPDNARLNRAFVTGGAAAALDADGRFVLGSGRSWTRSELNESDAKALADVYVHRFARTNAGFHERLRGKPINFEKLRPCGRAYYARSPYEEPAAGVPDAIVNVIAPRWIFTFCEDANDAAMSVAVATTATHLVMRDGRIDPMSLRGSEFYGLGVPAGKSMTVSPERAVERVATESGRRVAEVPVLVLPGLPWEPLAARWLLVTEAAIRVRNAHGQPALLNSIYVGRANLSLDVETFRGTVASALEPLEKLTGADKQEYQLRRLPSMPRRFEEVRIEEEN